TAPGGTKATGTQERVAIGPTKIFTAELTLRAKSGADVADIATRATDLITAEGGSLAGDRRTEAGSSTQADLILKVPPEKYPALLEQLAKLGKELSRSAQAEDVTDQVIDVASRVTSQEASVARIRKLLTGARTLGEVVQIEGELARREADLESLKARQRALDAQTSFATITLHVRGPAAAVKPPAKDERGFTAGLKAGWRAFAAATTWLLTAIGALLPFLILTAVVLAAVTAVRRRRGPRHPSPSPDPEPASAAAAS
ncbi:MAG: DUF4349 domain-containing protein, partial [Actinomycetota bacterium]|nr:DUF4349 domain-containing protein [Actinomycetota bacterium]